MSQTAGTFFSAAGSCNAGRATTRRITFLRRRIMNGVIYIIGLIVVIMFILSFLGLR
jgi:hypothetical protein